MATERPPRLTLLRRADRFGLEVGPALIAALLVLPWIISGGEPWPWKPAMLDLDVYLAAVRDLLAGQDIYLTRTPYWNLPFIYPPIAAILFVPLSFLPLWGVQLTWTVLTVLAQRVILVRVGIRRGAVLALVNVVLVLAVEPFRTTLGYGQVNTLLMALVVIDLLPASARTGRGRWLPPRGTFIGLAAAIKLTPLAFVVLAVLVGRRWTAVWSLVSFVLFTAIGALLMPTESLTFLRKVLTGDLYGDPVYVGNQSVNAVFARLLGTEAPVPLIGLAVAGLAGLAALAAAALWWRRGESVLAVGLTGLATCLASPLSWTHHHVWLLLIVIGAGSAAVSPAARALAYAWSAWAALCPVLVFLPHSSRVEVNYSLGQSVAANLGPLLGLMLVAILVAEAIGARTPAPLGRRAILPAEGRLS